MHLIINGKAQNGYFRLDNLDETRVGADFLVNPFAMVRTSEDAEFIIQAVKFYENQLEKDKENSMDEYWNTKGLA